MACLLFSPVSLLQTAYAQVILDGSMGAGGELSGPEFIIEETLGQQSGVNLFHSFSEFSLSEGESAVFTSSLSIQNIIARVTGGHQSILDGPLKANANLYFINPAGIVFGLGGTLSVEGSFYGSTADYLRFEDGERFYTNLDQVSALSISSPEAFGFVTGDTGGIAIVSPRRNTGLRVESKEGLGERNISLIAGNIAMDNGRINVSGGGVNLVAVASAGEVVMTDSTLDTSSFTEMGNITMTSDSIIFTTDDIFIRGGRFLISEKSSMVARSTSQDRERLGGIDISTNEMIVDDAEVSAFSQVEGRVGGDIKIQSEYLTITNGGVIQSTLNSASNLGERGKIIIHTDHLFIDGGSSGEPTGIAASTFLNTDSADQLIDPNIPDVDISAEHIDIVDGGSISINTSGLAPSGELQIQTRTLTIDGQNTASLTGITAETSATGQGGTIDLNVADSFVLRNNGVISTSSLSEGDAGDIIIDSGYVDIQGNAVIRSSSHAADRAGDAGDIHLTVENNVILRDESSISTQASDASGGNILFNEGNILYMANSDITTSVTGGEGDGGNMTVDMDTVILDQSRITAKAFGGRGGNINITTDVLLQSSDSLLDASSALGIDGSINIESPDIDIDSEVIVLPDDFLDASEWLKEVCNRRTGNNVSALIVRGRDGAYRGPQDLRSYPILVDPKKVFTSRKEKSKTEFYIASSHSGLREPFSCIKE